MAKSLRGEPNQTEAAFVRAVVAETEPVPSPAVPLRSVAAHSTERRIEIELTGGRRIIIDVGIDVAALRRIIEALDPR